MKRLFGIAYTLDLNWVDERVSDFEFDYNGTYYLFDKGKFYYSDFIDDDQDTEWDEVENKKLLVKLEKVLLENKEIETSFMEYVEKQLVELFEENNIINSIEEIKNI